MIYDLLCFLIIAAAVPFGVIYLLLRRTNYAAYSLPVSCLTFQPLLLAFVTVLGYSEAPRVSGLSVWGFCIAGLACTVYVAARHKREILAELSSNWKSLGLMFGAGLAAATVAGPVMAQRGFMMWMNGEYTNYSAMAGVFSGALHDPRYLPFFDAEAHMRYGAQLFLACMSVLTGHAAVFIVLAIAAFYKVTAVIAFVLVIDLLRREQGLLRWAVVVACGGFAFSTILALNHAMAFLAAQSVTASAILLGFIFLSDTAESVYFQAILAVHVLFVLITYSEAFPFLGLIAAVLFAENLCRRRWKRAGSLAVIYAAGLLVNPLLLYHRFQWLLNLRNSPNGFNVLGNPLSEPLMYAAGAFGFRYPFIYSWSPSATTAATVFLAFFAVCVGLLASTIRFRTLLFLMIGAVILYAQTPNPLSPPDAAFYRGYKTLAALDSFIFAGLAFLLDGLMRRDAWKSAAARACQIFLLAGAGVFVAGNLITSIGGTELIERTSNRVSEAEAVRAEAALRTGGGPAVVLAPDRDSHFWAQILMGDSVPLVYLGKAQVAAVYSNPNVSTEGSLLADKSRGPRGSMHANVLETDADDFGLGSQGSFDVRAFLNGAIPGLRLRETKTLLTEPGFRVVSSDFVLTGDPSAAADGRPNLAPSVQGVMPKSGAGTAGAFHVAFADPNGPSDVKGGVLTFGNSPTKGCYISFTRANREIGLALDDSARTWDTVTAGSPKNLQNKNCSIDGSRSTIESINGEVIVNLDMRFSASYRGRQKIWAAAVDNGGLGSDWHQIGEWDVLEQRK